MLLTNKQWMTAATLGERPKCSAKNRLPIIGNKKIKGAQKNVLLRNGKNARQPYSRTNLTYAYTITFP
jgi:hypothetical protein